MPANPNLTAKEKMQQMLLDMLSKAQAKVGGPTPPAAPAPPAPPSPANPTTPAPTNTSRIPGLFQEAAGSVDRARSTMQNATPPRSAGGKITTFAKQAAQVKRQTSKLFYRAMLDQGMDKKQALQLLTEFSNSVTPKMIIKSGVLETAGAMEKSWGEPTTVMKAFEKPATPGMLPGMAAEGGTPRIPSGFMSKIAGAAEAELPEAAGVGEALAGMGSAGVRGAGKGAQFLRGATSAGGLLKAGLGGLLAYQVGGPLIRMLMGWDKDKPYDALAQIKASKGYASSPEELQAMVEGIQARERRHIVLQKFEPDLYRQVVSSLVGESPPSELTSRETKIGQSEMSPEAQMMGKAKNPDQVKMLMQQFLEELGGS